MSYEVEDFEAEVIERSRQTPVVVDFWAPWCGPCRALAPVLEKLAAAAGSRWSLVKVNIDEHPEIAERFQIASIPAVKLFLQGEAADGFVGLQPEPQIRRWLERSLPSPNADLVGRARRLAAELAFQEAANLLEPVLAQEPSNEAARVVLAECLVNLDPVRVEPLLRTLASDSPLADKAAALRTLAGIAQMAEATGTLPESPVKPRFIEGAKAVRAGDHAAALEAFIDVLGRRRDYHGGAARDAGKAIFLLLGIRHPVSERFHRAFSSTLHS
jgi:putative thioredoxin